MTFVSLGVVVAVVAVVGTVLSAALFRRSSYSVPWFLVLGPSDYGRTALAEVLDTALAPNRGLRLGWRFIAHQLGLRVWGGEDGVVVDVAAPIAFPITRGDLARWRRVLRLLARHRPGRPIDGVILAIPVPRLRGNESELRQFGALVRERLVQIQGHVGFVLPIYVVLTQCDELSGFTAFAQDLPAHLRGGMIGWSNDRASAAVRDAVAGDQTAFDRLAFRRDWIVEGMSRLGHSLATTQIALLAASDSAENAAGLMLLSADVQHLADPLAQVLEEALRPNLYRGSCFLRGFYLCGRTAFADDLLHRRIFRERGLAIPQAAVAVSRLRGRLAAQVVCAVLAVGLVIGTAWSFLRLRAAYPAYARVLATGAMLTSNPGATPHERLIKRRGFLEQALAIKRGRVAELGTQIFMPASVPTERQMATTVRNAFAAMLDDFRPGLEEKWDQWQRQATFGPGDRLGPLGPDLKQTAPYKALDRFADGYEQFAENDERYAALGRAAGAGDLAAASGILEYLTGAGLSGTTLAPSLARAARETRATPIECRLFVDPQTQRSLVAMRASDLLSQFRTVSFDDAPEADGLWKNVVAGSSRFKANWASLLEPDADDRTLAGLMDDTTRLSDAVKAWAAFRGPSKAVAIPVFARSPFKQRPPAEGFCDALRPDLSGDMEAVEALRDRVTDRLLDDEVPPFGHLLEESDSGLAFTGSAAAFKAGLDDLRRQDFWQQMPANVSIALPASPTWRKEDTDAALKIGDAFDAYRSGAFRDLDDSYRTSVLNIIEDGVAEVIAARLAASAAAGRTPATDPGEITRFGVQLANMNRLTRWLESDARFGTAILVGLERQANASLDEIDREASSGYFFSRRRNGPITSAGVFDAWRGIENAAPAADAAKRWGTVVDDQREAVRRLASQAGPIVDFLSNRVSAERLQRWKAIAGDVASYDQKRPGNALSALEVVIRDGIPAMVPERGCGVAANPAPSGNGIFESVRKDLLDEGLRQCLEVRYASIAAEFNRQLSAKFPFSRSIDAASEASREAVAQFLRVYEHQGGRFLASLLNARSCRADASAFVGQMDKAYALLTSTAPVAAGSAPPAAPEIALDVAPEFRVARGLDNGGSQISEWELDIANQNFREYAASKPGTWTSGDPVSVQVRFARDSPNRPVSKDPPAMPAGVRVVVKDRTIRWDFAGDWALFRLLRSGGLISGGPGGLAQELAPAVLGFQIPVERDTMQPALIGQAPQSPFKIYMRIAVSPKDKTLPLYVEDFPYQAPIGAVCPGL